MNKMKQDISNIGEIVMYQPDETIRLEVRLEDETVWLNRLQMAELFGRDVKTIGKHIGNALHEELRNLPTVAKFAIVQKEGNRMVNRKVEYYSLDMVISVGYRVKSDKGIEFRSWANQVLKEYMLRGYSVNYQMRQLNQQQYGRRIEVKEYNSRFHDRFLILDDALYHFGASFKDLGKRLFAFELMGIDKNIILNQL